MYFAGVAIGLILVGLLTQMRQLMLSQPNPPAGGAPAPTVAPAADPAP